ncbi:MAG: glycosyltransferase 87 family protein [Bacteroidota bacterium]
MGTSLKYGLSSLLLGLTIGLGYAVEQSDFPYIISMYALFFVAYIFIYKKATRQDGWFFIGLGIVLRASLLFGIPNLSDDIYRFVWDGRLLLNGINPFDHLPSYYIEQATMPEGITQNLYDQLNSPNYFTIYPPVCQAVFALSCWVFPHSILGSAILMKLFVFACEVGSLLLLVRLLPPFRSQSEGPPPREVLLYALNPLIIIELCGNLHFEGPMIFFLLLALWCLQRQRYDWSAVAMALSIASKLLPLIFLPFLIQRLGWKKSLRYFIIVGALLLLFFLPLASGAFLANFGNSLDLYFRKFEFNASLYYLLRWVGFQLSGYNLIAFIGPGLALLVFINILVKAWREQNPHLSSLPLMMLFAICLYLSCTTTVHPWYASLPIVLCLFTRFRFPVLWSGLIVLTYINYSYAEYFENLWIVGIEYGLVVLFFWMEYTGRLKNLTDSPALAD